MAFSIENLSCIANNAKSGVIPAVWEYFNKSSDTVTTAGYFPVKCGIKAGDKILVISSTASDAPVWHYAAVSSNVITVSACTVAKPSMSIDDLSDVTITTAANGNTLKYNGSKWVNDTPSINDLSDVTITSAADDDVLTYSSDATSWVNSQPSS